MTTAAKPLKIKHPVRCHGCGKPTVKQFIWTDTRAGRKRPYCIDCDLRLIQGVGLPGRKK